MNHKRLMERLRDPEFLSRTGTREEIAAAADAIDRITAENERLRERLGPRGLEVVEIDGAGHYVNEKVKAAMDRITAERDGLRKVRPLDWQVTFIDRGDGHQDPTGFEAETPFGNWYRVAQYFGSDSYGFQVEYDSMPIGDFDDPDRAQACAQEHFEKCIRAALAVSDADKPGV